MLLQKLSDCAQCIFHLFILLYKFRVIRDRVPSGFWLEHLLVEERHDLADEDLVAEGDDLLDALVLISLHWVESIRFLSKFSEILIDICAVQKSNVFSN